MTRSKGLAPNPQKTYGETIGDFIELGVGHVSLRASESQVFGIPASDSRIASASERSARTLFST